MVKELTNLEFFDAIKSRNSVVDFGADWCMPCKLLSPVFESLSKEIKEANFFKVDVDKEPELAEKFGVMSVPTIIILKNGKEVSRINGFSGKESLKAQILSKIK